MHPDSIEIGLLVAFLITCIAIVVWFYLEYRKHFPELLIFQMNEYDWVAAVNLNEAVNWYLINRPDRHEILEFSSPLSEMEMDTLLYLRQPQDGKPPYGHISFRNQLEILVRENASFPRMFLSLPREHWQKSSSVYSDCVEA